MTNDISSDLGTRLRLAREAKGMRQEDVAEGCGVTQQAVQSWEANRSTPRGLQRIAKLAELLGLEPADIRGTPVAVLTHYETRREVTDSMARILEDKRPYERPRFEGAQLTSLIREERRAELLNCLPENLRPHVGATLDIRGTPHRFDYLSRRVVAGLVYLPAMKGMVSPTALRLSLYRIAVANRHYNDFPVPDRHYLLAVIPTPSVDVRIPKALQNEGRLFDTSVEIHADIKTVCARIVELEEKQTELEEITESQVWYEDLDFDESPPSDF